MTVPTKNLRLCISIASATLVCALIGACGGGAGGGEARENVTPPPSATITFPGDAAFLTEGRVTIRGTASVETAIRQVMVNGVQATSSNGFANWEATLDLPAGVNALIVSAEDVKGNKKSQAATATVTVGPWFQSEAGRRIAMEASGKILVTDGAFDKGRLLRVDPSSGARAVVSGATSGELRFSGYNALAVEKTGNVVVGDCVRVLRVDAGTGLRSVVSDATIGSGPLLNCVSDVAVEPSGKLVVLDWAGEEWRSRADKVMRVVRIDPLTGDRRIVSDGSNGTGPQLTASSIAVESTGQLLVSNLGAWGTDLVRVDPVTGARTVVSAASAASGPTTIIDTRLRLQPGGQVLVAESYWDRPSRVSRVDPQSGVRTVISDASTGSGPNFVGYDPVDIAIEASGQLVVATSERITRIDPANGARTIASQVSIGSGPGFMEPTNLVVVEQAGSLLVVDYTGTSPNRIVRVDARSGARTIVSDGATGGGPLFGAIAGITVERAGGIVVLDRQPASTRIVRVDPSSGARTVVAEGLSTVLNAIAVDAAGRFVMAGSVFGSGDLVLRIGAQGAAPTIISSTPPPDLSGIQGPIHGLGSQSVTAMAIAPNGQLIVAGLGGGIVRVDPVSGARTTLAPDQANSLALDAEGNIFLGNYSAVSRLDSATGLSTTIASSVADLARGIALEASGMLPVTSSRKAVMRMDPRNGQLAMISR